MHVHQFINVLSISTTISLSEFGYIKCSLKVLVYLESILYLGILQILHLLVWNGRDLSLVVGVRSLLLHHLNLHVFSLVTKFASCFLLGIGYSPSWVADIPKLQIWIQLSCHPTLLIFRNSPTLGLYSQ
jgi:hypothetical protein